MRLALELLGGHVGYGSAHLLDTTRARTLGNQDKAEITEQDLAAAPQQHILRLDVAVNELAVMCVLQGRRSLLDVRNKDGGGQYNPFRVALAQGAIGGIVHDEKRNAVLHAKVEDADDVGVDEAGDGAGFIAELLHTAADQAHLKHFDGCLGIQVNMLAEVDVGEPALPDYTHQVVAAELLSNEVGHLSYPSLRLCWRMTLIMQLRMAPVGPHGTRKGCHYHDTNASLCEAVS